MQHKSFPPNQKDLKTVSDKSLTKERKWASTINNKKISAGMMGCSLSTAEVQMWLSFLYTLTHNEVALHIFTRRSLGVKATTDKSMQMML